jgi:sterol desaturase/sphingolipid hydroxylase (fatty acid hydroxylase superfamily)
MLLHHIRSYICYIILFIVTKRMIVIEIIVEYTIDWVSFMMRSLLLMILYDFAYYVLHYLLHSNAYLYRTIHKVHHYYQCEHPLIAHYTSIIELVILNLYLIIIIMILLKFSFFECIIISIIGTIMSCIAHSNIIEDDHDKHHKYINCNYSLFGLSDILFNTYHK